MPINRSPERPSNAGMETRSGKEASPQADVAEGSKPIFEREELKADSSNTAEVEERRTVIAIENGTSVKSSKLSKQRSVSSRSPQDHSRSSYPSSSRCTRARGYSSDSFDSRIHSDNHRKRSRDRSKESERVPKEQSVRRHRSSRGRENSHSRDKKNRRTSRSEDRDQRRRDRSPYHSSYRDDRSTSRSHRNRSTSKGRRESEDRRIAPHYIEPVPYPVYYGSFPPPRPIMMAPIMPIRGQMPVPRNRPPPMPIRPFMPRFMPSSAYRMGPPPGPRFGPMF